MKSLIDLQRWELFNYAPQMDAINQKASMLKCKETSNLPLLPRHQVREGSRFQHGYLESEMEVI